MQEIREITVNCCRSDQEEKHLDLLNFVRFLWAHFSILCRSPWMASLPSVVSITLLSSVSSANLLRGYLISLSVIDKDVRALFPIKISERHHASLVSHWTESHWQQLSVSLQPIPYPLHPCPPFKFMSLSVEIRKLCGTTKGLTEGKDILQASSFNYFSHFIIEGHLIVQTSICIQRWHLMF